MVAIGGPASNLVVLSLVAIVLVRSCDPNAFELALVGGVSVTWSYENTSNRTSRSHDNRLDLLVPGRTISRDKQLIAVRLDRVLLVFQLQRKLIHYLTSQKIKN